MTKIKLMLLSGTMLLLLSLGCKKVKEALQVDIGFTTKVLEFTMPAIPIAGSATYDVPAEIQIDSFLQANNFSMDQVRKISLEKIELIQDNGSSTNNLEPISHVRVEMASAAKPDFVEIAKLDDNTLPMADPFKLVIPGNTDLDLKPYFSTHQFTYRVSVGLREATSEEKECTILTRYIVTVGG